MASPSTAIVVSGLGPATTRESLEHFFSFCGKIKSIERFEKSASVVFENHAATKTSIMLDGGTLDGSVIQVRAVDEQLNNEHLSDHKSDHPGQSAAPWCEGTPNDKAEHREDIGQEDKPRSAIAAEYLAHGYVLGDHAISKAIAIDQKHGISTKFLGYFRKIQEKALKCTSPSIPHPDAATTPTAGTTYTQKLQNWKTLSTQQYEKALKSPSGAKVYKFYTGTSKQILDVHNEAKRIAESKLGHPVFSPVAPTTPHLGTEARGGAD